MKKSRLFSILLTFCICVCTFVVGVWAAKTATVSNGGSVSFTANGVYAEASGTISGAGTVKNGTTDYTPATGQSAKLPTLVFDYKTSEGGEGALKGGESGVLPSWKNNDLAFTKMGDKITLTITVKNLAPDRDLYAQLVNNNTSITNLTTTITGGTKNIAFLAKGGTNSVTFTIELEPTNRNMKIPELTYSFTLNLSLEEIVPPLEVMVLAEVMSQSSPGGVAQTFPSSGYTSCSLENNSYALDLSIFEGIEDVTLNPNISRTLIVNLKFKNTVDQWMDVQAVDGFLEYLQGTSTDLRLNIPNTGEAIAPTSFTSTQETNTGLTKEVTLQLKVRYLSSSTATLKPFANISGTLFNIKTSSVPTFLPYEWLDLIDTSNGWNGVANPSFTGSSNITLSSTHKSYFKWNQSLGESGPFMVSGSEIISNGRIYAPPASLGLNRQTSWYDADADFGFNGFEGIDLTNFDTSYVTSLSNIRYFGKDYQYNCYYGVTRFNGSLFMDTSNVFNLGFLNDPNANADQRDGGIEIDFRNFDVAKVTDFTRLFYGVGRTETYTLDLTSFEIPSTHGVQTMFLGIDVTITISDDLWLASRDPAILGAPDWGGTITVIVV